MLAFERREPYTRSMISKPTVGALPGVLPAALPRGRLAEAAYEHLKAKLLDGSHAAGSSVSVEAVVRELGVSRQPVMEAVKRLAGEGFLEIIPQVGCRVVAPDRREIEDFFRVFSVTEGLCAELAAMRATDAEFAQLESIARGLELKRGQSAEEQAQRYRIHNRELHGQIHNMAHSQTLHAVAGGLWDRSDFFINTAIGTIPFVLRFRDAVNEHADIIAAMRRRDGSLARRRMEEHVFAFARAMDGRAK